MGVLPRGDKEVSTHSKTDDKEEKKLREKR